MFRSRHRHSKVALVILLGFAVQHAQAEAIDLTELSLEQLLTVEVSSASKYSQRIADAPSAVQIITREDIQRHGWRSLTEALNSLPGIYSVNDRSYDYLGARGFLIPGDYNTRFLLLIDGQRNNDNIYQMGLTGGEGWLDMSVVERIEYIPGPGSAIYGSNAMFGVINVITRGADKSDQSQVSTYASKLGLTGVSAMTSQTFGDTGLVMQYSAEHQAGRDQTYTDPVGNLFRADGSPATDVMAHGLDKGNNRRLMMRVDHQQWSFRLINHERTLIPSSAPYFTVFDDPAMQLNDGGTQLSAALQHELSDSSSLYARIGYTDWYYRATYPYNYDFTIPAAVAYYLNYDDVGGQILDGEFRYQLKSGAHHLLTGLEFSKDMMARQRNAYSDGTPGTDTNKLISHGGVFAQDEWRFAPDWLLSMGLRADSATGSKPSTSPRLGLIWQANPGWTAKLLTGQAYRSPNSYERWFSQEPIYLDNPNLQPETIRTTEAVLEWMKDARTRWVLSLFDNKVGRLIQQVDTGAGLQYQNGTAVHMHGAELSVNKATDAGMKLRASAAYNQSQNVQGTSQGNSPRWMAKASASAPVISHAAILAAEL